MQLLEGLRSGRHLLERHEAQLRALVEKAPLSRLASSGLALSAWWKRIVTQLESHTWDIQNEAMLTLSRVGSSAISQLDDEAQEQLGRNVTQAAEGDAYRAVNFAGDVAAARDRWPPAFVRGMVLEAFANEEGMLRLKVRQLLPILRSLNAVSEEERDVIIGDVAAALREGVPRNAFMFVHERGSAIEIMRQAAQEQGLHDVAGLISALEAVAASPRR